MIHHTDAEVVRFFHHHIHPLLIHLYVEARIEVPDEFNYRTEGPRLVAALREQGFNLHFIDTKGKVVE